MIVIFYKPCTYIFDSTRKGRIKIMDLKIFKDIVTTVGQFANTRQELPIETEILIPDYLNQVFKVIKCFVSPVLLQKQVVSGRVVIEGYFKIQVFYQGQDGELCTIDQKLPFSRQIELNQGDWIQTVVDVTGEIGYINCRAINQRRLDIRGAYNLNIKVLATVNQEIITAVSEMGLQQKTLDIDASKLLVSPDKQFTVEEEISFDIEPKNILHTQSHCVVTETKMVSGKIVAKGDINTDILYTADDLSLHHAYKTLQFNQILELDGAAETADCQVNVSPIGCTVLFQGEEQKQYQISVTCIVGCKAICKQQTTLVVDSFSTHYQTSLQMKEIFSETMLDTLSTTVLVETQGKLPDSDINVLECFATCFPPEIAPLENDVSTKIQGKAIIHLICVNALGEIECLDKACEYVLPKKYDVPINQIEASLVAQCSEVSFTKIKDDVTAKLAVVVSGMLMRKNHLEVLDNVVCEEKLQTDKEIALRIYYAQAGEAVFDIAKRYHASPQDIAMLAGIDEQQLEQNQRLLIPVAE